MIGPFRLDVDPDAVEASGRRLAEVGAALELEAASVVRAGSAVPSGWRGASADTVTRELAGLDREISASAPHFSHAQESLARLASTYREGEAAMVDLNRRWEQAEAVCASAVAGAEQRQSAELRVVPTGLPPEDRALLRQDAARAADLATSAAAAELASAKRSLQAEFAELGAALRRATARTGVEIAGATAVPVPALRLQAAVMTRALGGLFGLGYPTVDASAFYAGSLPLADLLRQLAAPPADRAALAQLLDRARSAGLPPPDYAVALRGSWTAVAFEEAGIDPALWRPELGAEANREIIEKVYEYYGKLYLDNPYLHRAGMASLIGPSFAAGFFDLNLLQRSADVDARTGAPGLPPGLEAFAAAGAADVRWYEQKFLTVQRDSFLDQAMMHEAYRDGGLAAIRELAAASQLPPEMVRAWEDIDAGGRTGDAAARERGNTALLDREQFQIIANSCDRMRERPVAGRAVTFMMTLVGGPSIPGAQGCADVFPSPVSQSVPGVDVPSVSVDNPVQGTVHVETPLHDGNISDRQSRRDLIEQDTLPAYLRFPREDPPSEQEGPVSSTRERFAESQQVHLDIREPVLPGEVGVAPGDRAYIVERADGSRFLDVELTLPGDRVLDVQAIGVVFAGASSGTGLDRIVVNGVAEDLPAAEGMVDAVRPVLGLRADEVRAFFGRVRPGRDGRDQTVLLGAPQGYLRPAVEVLYRGPEDRLTINITLSWDPAASGSPAIRSSRSGS